AVELKGLYIKVGQFISTRADIAPEPYVRILSQLQDRVPPRPADMVETVMREDLGTTTGEAFAEFEQEPIAAASLAQVHRARMHDGRTVAVKVLYPEVAGLVRLDLRNLRTLARLVAWREPSFDYRTIVEELARQFPLEVDFEREARMTEMVAANLRGYPRIVVPDVVRELSGPRIVVTEYLEGQRVIGAHIDALPQEERERLAAEISGAFGHQVLVDGLFQADPHPGNLLLLNDGRVGLLDFGLTKELPEAMRVGFARLVVAAASRDPVRIVKAFQDLGVRVRNDRPEDLLMLSSLFFDARPIGEERGHAARERSQALARNPVEAIPGDLVLLGRVVGLLRGVCASMGVSLSPMEMLRPYAEQVLEEEKGAAPDGP
ncbi:MAG: AarF/ABC1/UbiB kinase family protein, partial [Dehalococcoidia bacterium]|nr:AarF/ABC1/UbiB kinase family protein [Dehalococcoidia bacterium]